jgi:hypothetical protein
MNLHQDDREVINCRLKGETKVFFWGDHKQNEQWEMKYWKRKEKAEGDKEDL